MNSNSASSGGTHQPVLLAGPTAVGKSEVALRLAELIGGEIVSFDSMQVYCGMDIGTAKPSPADRARVPHHLLDVVPVAKPFDAAQFVEHARKAVDAIRRRDRTPILCGGTGLYFQAFLHGLREAPAADPGLRAELEKLPLEVLLRELRDGDPETYHRIDRRNPRRVIRAVEVLRLGGRPPSGQGANWRSGETGQEPQPGHFGLERETGELRLRIDRRVEEMFRAGLVEETRQLLAQGLETNRTAMQALGYRQVVEHLRGERGLAETIELVKTRTRLYAKRQMTWFRRQLSLNWIALSPEDTAGEVAARIAEAVGET